MKDNKDRKKAQKGTLLKVLKRIKKYSGFLILSILMAAVTVASTLYAVSYTHLTLPTILRV